MDYAQQLLKNLNPAPAIAKQLGAGQLIEGIDALGEKGLSQVSNAIQNMSPNITLTVDIGDRALEQIWISQIFVLCASCGLMVLTLVYLILLYWTRKARWSRLNNSKDV